MNNNALAAEQDAATLLLSVQQSLGAAQQRIWAASALQLLRRMALLCLALGLALLTIHFLLRALPSGVVVTLLLLPLVAGLLLALCQRPSLAESAAWLDCQLQAESVFATYLEFVVERRAVATPRALHAFVRRSAPVVEHSSGVLRKPAATSMLPVAALWGICFGLVVALLWLPGRSVTATPGTINAAAESAVAGPTLNSESEQSSRAVRAALLQDRQNKAPGPGNAAAANSPAAAPPTDDSGGAGTVSAAQQRASGATANGEGSDAGRNAALVREADAAALRTPLHSRFRDITLGSQRNAPQDASGSAVALTALSLTAHVADFDREQAVLAGRAVAAQVSQPAASGPAGPSGALLQRRYLQLRNTTP